MKMVSSPSFLSLEYAMAQPHGTEIDIVAGVAFVCPPDYTLLHPYGIRELCLKGTSQFFHLSIL
jgi:hypothetical protein